VWDYPRPPRLERSDRRVLVRAGAEVVAASTAAWRVLETSHPPTWYLPRDDVRVTLRRSAAGPTVCEWKGVATYWDVPGADGRMLSAAAWSYERPTDPFREIAGSVAFRADLLTCTVDDEAVTPQQGFYAGWITADVVGPFKGGPGTMGW
jgi:uncharacterized protein (DUF427 family)